MKSFYKGSALTGACSLLLIAAASAHDFDIPSGNLKAALDAYVKQSGVTLMYSLDAVKNARTTGVKGDLPASDALTRILNGTGFTEYRNATGAVGIIRDERSANEDPIELAQAMQAPRSSVETVTVTSSKLGGADVQSVPIAITAMSQEQLTATQTAGGPDLVKNVPNLTFTKTNFTGYSIQIRGIGTQAISVTTDPAVAVAFNDTPFIRNHFFEQEFFDVSQVEVLRGPQGTLYGRNATAGVVNLVSAKPTDQWEAMASVDVGNYNQRRLEGMLNIPILGDKLAIRAAGEWTKRDGYAFNETTDRHIDGRDLWSGRVTIGFNPIEQLHAHVVWEHFDEKDDRARSTKQLCKKDPGPDSVDGLDIANTSAPAFYRAWLTQGCLPASLYAPESYQTPNGQAIPFVAASQYVFNGLGGAAPNGFLLNPIDPYASQTQPRDLRVIQSQINPTYSAKSDTFELNADLYLTPNLTLTSQTGYNKDQLRSTEDFNRFNTAVGLFGQTNGVDIFGRPTVSPGGVYCDPQLGCSTEMVAEDLSQEHAWQFSQEVRLASKFDGPLNFSVGANYLHYQTVEDYYVFFNLLTAMVQLTNSSPPNDFENCYSYGTFVGKVPPTPFTVDINGAASALPSNYGCYGSPGDSFYEPGTYIDPNSIDNLDGQGHNYFRSENPYHLNSFAGFGEAYYQLTPDVKLTAGLRWTDDRKKFWNIPSWVFLEGGGYPVQSVVDQEWKEWTGRFNVNWTPKLDFTDQTLVYATFAHGYKGGGANPPGPKGDALSAQSFATHPPTFKPEFINAFEVGTKNTLFDGALTLNSDAFFYDYKGYQISQIVDRTSINLNFDGTVKGLELESVWEPLPGLRFNLASGLQSSSINDGQSAIDLIDRTAGHSDWMIVKPYPTSTSNCVLPASVVRQLIVNNPQDPTATAVFNPLIFACDAAYAGEGNSSLFGSINPDLSDFGVTGFDHTIAPNNGAGFAKDLSGNDLPNTPHLTLSVGAQYTTPLSESWAGTLRGDFYAQTASWARVFNDDSYDRIHGYTSLNFALILTNEDGWQAMAYVKNALDTTAITGAFLNSDDTALTTNVFVTDPRLFGIRVTKNW
ncbi:MAG TPA: TonB-dependent receptor [Rhizomicrobium sp.]|nr:TonB-dependent receptor [Rhizomicrobium sp.]